MGGEPHFADSADFVRTIRRCSRRYTHNHFDLGTSQLGRHQLQITGLVRMRSHDIILSHPFALLHTQGISKGICS